MSQNNSRRRHNAYAAGSVLLAMAVLVNQLGAFGSADNGADRSLERRFTSPNALSATEKTEKVTALLLRCCSLARVISHRGNSR